MATRADVFIQILSEVSGRPKEDVAGMLEVLKASIPGQDKFDEPISEEEAATLLEGLRNEKEGILAWLIRGHRDFVLRNFPPAGSA